MPTIRKTHGTAEDICIAAERFGVKMDSQTIRGAFDNPNSDFANERINNILGLISSSDPVVAVSYLNAISSTKDVEMLSNRRVISFIKNIGSNNARSYLHCIAATRATEVLTKPEVTWRDELVVAMGETVATEYFNAIAKTGGADVLIRKDILSAAVELGPKAVLYFRAIGEILQPNESDAKIVYLRLAGAVDAAELAEKLSSLGLVSRKTVSRFSDSMHFYNDIPSSRKGMINAVRLMLCNVLKRPETDYSGRYVEAAVGYFADLFSESGVIDAVHMATGEMKNNDASDVRIEKNLHDAFYSEEARVNRFGYGPLRLGKPVFYNKTYTLKSLRTIGRAYGDYPKIREFLGGFGLNIVVPEMGIRKGLAERGYSGEHLPGISYIDPIIGNTNTVVHEIVHGIQEPAASGTLYGYPVHMAKTLEEAGAELVTMLYKLNEHGGAGDTGLLIRMLLKNFSVMRHFESKLPGGRGAMLEEIGRIYNTLRTGFELQPETVEQKFSRYTSNSALGGVERNKSIAFATLVLACNNFDVKETVLDLVEPERLENIIHKMANAVDSDFDGRILASTKKALYT